MRRNCRNIAFFSDGVCLYLSAISFKDDAPTYLFLPIDSSFLTTVAVAAASISFCCERTPSSLNIVVSFGKGRSVSVKYVNQKLEQSASSVLVVGGVRFVLNCAASRTEIHLSQRRT